MRYQLRYVRVSPAFPGDGENSTRRQDRLCAAPTRTVIALVDDGVLTPLDSTPHPLKEAVVGIGTSIFLLAVGAILTFALNASIGGVNLDVVGWILMAAGALGLIMTTLVWGRRRTVVTTDQPVEYRRVEERRDVAPPL
ncbi:DUF6458 family protein [Micromonospora sp. KC723]|uniref:DUF6458 family protein n=1 Tax=Micromonospora sp. KC723 TaxID=2530381 RepID=UPI001FB7908F|nr:DUF6458 family protein [Micromonospora sp. KC723]